MLSGKNHFRSISLCYNLFIFMLRRLYMKIVVNLAVNLDWSAQPALYVWGEGVFWAPPN